ncbi:MAG: fused MFS/spermidine synthase [Bacteroidales bacterium]
MKKYLIGIIILITGALTMIFELAGARVLGPYYGTSIFVWTSLIGVVMGSLSAGYWFGGWYSTQRSDYVPLFWMLLIASVFVLVTATGHDYILKRIIKYVPGFRTRIFASALFLFGPASVFFGMILPYAIKIKINNVRTSGSAVGNLYALSTLGSILGTFMAGFVLVPAYGYANILYSISAVLIIFSLLTFIPTRKWVFATAIAFCGALLTILWIKENSRDIDYVDVDTQYNRVIIYNTTDQPTGRPVKMLKVNDERSSAMFTDKDDDLVFEVLKYYRLAEHFNKELKSSLMIGGSGYAFPKDYLSRYPEASIDVVEIDPGLTALAKQYFKLPDDPRLSIFHEDGRTYLNRCTKKYDAVFMDAYKSMITIPYQLTTIEAIKKIHDVLTEKGAVYANVISSLDYETNYFLRAELATYREVFPYVYLFAVQYPNPTEEEKKYFQNIMLVASKTEIPSGTSENEAINTYLSNRIYLEETGEIEILTDEYAPVEYYAAKVLH